MRKRRDWDGELALWIQFKIEDPKLTAADFFRRRGINEHLGRKRIGVKMGSMWGQIRDRALQNLEKKGALNLTKSVEQILEAHKKEFAIAERSLLIPDETTGRLKFEPKNFDQAMKMLHGGSRGIQGAIHTLSGGEALSPAQPRKYRIEWIPPESYRPNPKKKQSGRT